MIGQVIMLMMVGVIGMISFQVVRGIATSLCINTTGWSTTETTLICQIVGTVTALAVIILLFIIIAKAAAGLST
jgi:hypothetical protein